MSRDGRLLDMSVKEFGVLEALLLDAPAFLRAEDLLERVCDEQADPFTNTVAVTIGRLRRKLGDPRSLRPHRGSAAGSRRRLTDRPPDVLAPLRGQHVREGGRRAARARWRSERPGR